MIRAEEGIAIKQVGGQVTAYLAMTIRRLGVDEWSLCTLSRKGTD